MARRLSHGEREAGFTLIELLVVIVILGILAGIAVPVFLNQRRKAVDASMASDIRALAQIQETWLVDHPGSPGFNWDSRTGVTVPAGLALDVKVSHADTVLYTYGRSPEGGYCVKSHNPRSTRSGTTWMLYDSLHGGLFVWKDPPAGGAC